MGAWKSKEYFTSHNIMIPVKDIGEAFLNKDKIDNSITIVTKKEKVIKIAYEGPLTAGSAFRDLVTVIRKKK